MHNNFYVTFSIYMLYIEDGNAKLLNCIIGDTKNSNFYFFNQI